MAPPFIYARSSGDGTGTDAVISAAVDGNLRRLRGTVERLADPKIIFSFNMSGIGVLHIAASGGHLEVCKYLVEELGGDVNAPTPGDGGVTPFMLSAQSGDLSTVKYLLDRGGDLMRADGKGRTVLHHAACAGVPVDMDCGRGTALHQAAYNEQDKTVKILLEHHADPNATHTSFGTALFGALMYRSLKCMKLLIKAGADVNRTGSTVRTLLTFATGVGGYTNFVKLLLKAGADPNIPDELGRLPIELAAIRGSMEEVEMLFPLTSPIPSVPNWSIDGIISHAKFESAKPMDKRSMEKAIALAKSKANQAFRMKEYKVAIKLYDMAIDLDIAPSATVYANRSLCKQLLGDGEGALSDAVRCRMLRPNWAKACYRQAAAHILLKEYKQACDALLDAKKIDPGNMEIERELRKARELMKASHEAAQ